MASVCLYFQLHQPFRLRRYSVFDTQSDYFDSQRNAHILRRVAERCYIPATRTILDLIKKHDGRFRVAYCLTGLVVEQLREHCPEVIELLQQAAATGCVEFLSETYHHSLAFIFSRDEFKQQVELHAGLMKDLFDARPQVFRNTELIYNNEMATYVAGMGKYLGMLSEGADHVLGKRSPNIVYHPPGRKAFKLLLKNYRLSDDIAFRFSNRSWDQWPLTAEKFARSIAKCGGQVCNLFMDYETFGEHQWEETGIFGFLREMPGEVLKSDGLNFKLPGEAMKAFEAGDEYDAPHMISWADTERDLSAWLGNAMQSNALHELYRLEQPIKASQDPALLDGWRKLTSSDHFYYMCTKYFADGDVHKYFNPYESPYDSYINFMNVLDSLRTRVEATTG